MLNDEQLNMPNQLSYKANASEHDSLNLESTLYLAYRDISKLLSGNISKKSGMINLLDFGCGVGLSTTIYEKIIRQLGYDVNITGVDLSLENLAIAKQKLPHANLMLALPGDGLTCLEKFDIILCIFVLVEMNQRDMDNVLSILHSKLSDDGLLVVVNTTEEVYKPEYTWHGFHANFPENTVNQGYKEDQRVKVKVFSDAIRKDGFIFYDYFHSESAYAQAYGAAGFNVVHTLKPLGTHDDAVAWQSELAHSPYLIHLLAKRQAG